MHCHPAFKRASSILTNAVSRLKAGSAPQGLSSSQLVVKHEASLEIASAVCSQYKEIRPYCSCTGKCIRNYCCKKAGWKCGKKGACRKIDILIIGCYRFCKSQLISS